MVVDYCSICEKAVSSEESSDTIERKKNFYIIIVSGTIMVWSILFDFLFNIFIISQILAAIVVFISGYEVVKEGILKLIRKKITINILMTVAVIGSFVIGHGGEGAGVMLLYFIAEFLEDYATDRSKKSVISLMKIAPDTAFVKENDTYKEVHTHDVSIGSIVRIKPGEIIPLDGIIVNGMSNINEASLTGESIPNFRQIEDEVFAGTIVIDGYIEIKVTKTSDHTILAKIKKIINESRGKKTKTERFIDEFARYYTPIMIILAITVMTLPPLLFRLSIYDWIYRGLILLVISCPCALALSTPISVVSALTSGARNGILIKGGQYFEDLNKIDIMAFDKTGTLTEGSLEINDIVFFNGNHDQWYSIIAGLESLSEHPISKAIINDMKAKKIIPAQIHNFKSIAGKGVSGSFNGSKFYLGNKSLFLDLDIKIPEELMISYEQEGKTTVLFGTENQILGLISLRDKLRNEARRVINNLKNKNIKTILISGDNRRTVESIQNTLNIDFSYYELKPHEKQQVIKNYTLNNETIAMVGDGVNDAPALATANVGIAMGGIGSDMSLETADIILMNDNLEKIITLLNISKKTNRIIKQNIYFSITIKLFFVVLTFFGIMNLWLAVGIGDLGVTFIVILNAFRIPFGIKFTGDSK
ncbi:MAG: heavy metal translocating P-type ATPase [Candidatus Helarchaeota archaeon]